MTKPLTRPHLKPGPKPKPIPLDAAKLIEDLAADGFTVVGIAKRLNTTSETLNLWMDKEPALKEAFAAGREAERYALHNALYRAATEDKNMTAAMFLLKARHGYREGDQAEQGNRVSINFTLPGAMTLENFTKAIEHEPDNSNK